MKQKTTQLLQKYHPRAHDKATNRMGNKTQTEQNAREKFEFHVGEDTLHSLQLLFSSSLEQNAREKFEFHVGEDTLHSLQLLFSSSLFSPKPILVTPKPMGVNGIEETMFEFLGSLVGCNLQLLSGVPCIASAFYLMHSFCYFSCSPYWGLTSCPSGAWLFSFFVLLSGNPGFTAGRGFNLAGGAPGGG
ncbi:hypothetical protein F511_26992 [Dorcoceras hygrometricum]|uniref:Uncharacterized protein n=1 Tax=Dorcoceras hygrometricum TaxID=472368 RepID=A0A2Z7CNM1_9LAMI|nr:hypothetical protein F511_26992 [Dorcoceras hygrometricum]